MGKHKKHEMSLHERLRLAREYAGISQGQAAKLLDMHRPTVTEIEQGRRKVSIQELKEFSRIYAVDLDWLINSETKINSMLDNKVQLAARNLAKLKHCDLNKVIALLQAIQKAES